MTHYQGHSFANSTQWLRPGIVLKNLIVIVLGFILIMPACASEQITRYRGQYSFGHEVNSFCPEINSQCYWLSPDTAQQQRKQLKQLVEENTDKPYEAICVVVEGQINRDPAAKAEIGFAADYDGLFTVSRLYGLCNKPRVVTEGDLQHHRWVLESINGEKIDAAILNNVIPELEIGEQMMASGNSGCNRFFGKAELRENRFIIEKAATTRMMCPPAQNEMERLFLQLLGQESTITIDTDRNLFLETDQTQFRFRIEDWVQ
jgi:heat shock protein HslJ